MAKIEIDREQCKGCKLCVSVCPKKIIEINDVYINQKGVYAAQIIDKKKCIGCAFCATICPDCIIEIRAGSAQVFGGEIQ